MKTLVLTTVLGLLAGTAQAGTPQTTITTRPGPFRGYTQTDVRQGSHVTHCTTRPGPFKGTTTTDCQ
jgi:hypothetical protein